uniref:N-acetyltransferase domain-containing protein n=1 Tax=Steinernema glaseri TaxID=37863 RepID=A0A1I7Z1J1_9BILA
MKIEYKSGLPRRSTSEETGNIYKSFIKYAPCSMAMDSIVIDTNASQEDFEQCVKMALDLVEWRMADGDYEAFKKGFPGNFVLYVARDTGEMPSKAWLISYPECDKVVGFCLFSTQYTLKEKKEISTFGCFLVLPEYRNRRIGAKLFQLATEAKIKEGKNVSLQAAVDMRGYYATRGFKLTCPGPNPKVLFDPSSVSKSRLETLCKESADRLGSEGLKIVDVDRIDDEALNVFERSVADVDRSAYTSVWLRRPDVLTKTCVDSEGNVLGYACLRHVSGRRLLFSPIFARNEPIARAMVLAALLATPDLQDYKEVCANALVENTAIKKIFEDVVNGEVDVQFTTQKMFTMELIEWKCDQIFAYTALGCVCL